MLQNAENRVVSQVFVRLFSGARQGSGSMTINMHPPELGSVKVRIASESGHLNVSLHPQNHQVVGILERHLPTLQQSLADQGIDISDMQVSVDSGGEEGTSRFEEQAFDGRQQRASKTETADPDAKALAETSQASESNSESGLSLRV
ncbi:MAG: flagellar hook-length control protein FliK [Thermodesulfobacteriota bacterium]